MLLWMISGDDLHQVGLHFCRDSHNPVEHHDHLAFPFSPYPHEHAFHPVKFSPVNAHARTFPYVDLLRLVINRLFLVTGGDLDETVHLLVRDREVLPSRAFFPCYELKEIVAFFLIQYLKTAGMHEDKIRDDRNKTFGLHPVVGSYCIMFRYEIF